MCILNAVIIDKTEHPPEWQKIERTDASVRINLILALKQQNVDELINKLLSVSSPTSNEYGNHLSFKQIASITKPSISTIKTVYEWLLSSHINSEQIEDANPLIGSDFIRINDLTVGFVEQLLDTEYYNYSHKEYPNYPPIARVHHETNYHVPIFIANKIDFISPTKRFPSYKYKPKISYRSPQLDPCNPTNLKQLYNVGNATGKAKSNLQAIAGFLDQLYNKNDLEAFWSEWKITPTKITNIPIDQPSGKGAEAELDTQYLTSIGESIDTQYWYTPGRDPNNPNVEPFLEWILNVENTTNPPNLFSVSYGDDERALGYSYTNRLNTEFAKMGTAGITFLFASGDDGAGGNCSAANNYAESPDYPASSPWITCVGGAVQGTIGKSPTGETGWVDSGGGFSNFFAAPKYQLNATIKYINSKEMPAQYKWNKTGRGYPDISAQSLEYQVIQFTEPVSLDGTSCSTVTAAGIFSLLNDLRLQNNMKVLGFVNPLIYQIGMNNHDNVFNDVIYGKSTGCADIGFPTANGWDAVTGFGTPNYQLLTQRVIQTGQKTLKFT